MLPGHDFLEGGGGDLLIRAVDIVLVSLVFCIVLFCIVLFQSGVSVIHGLIRLQAYIEIRWCVSGGSGMLKSWLVKTGISGLVDRLNLPANLFAEICDSLIPSLSLRQWVTNEPHES